MRSLVLILLFLFPHAVPRTARDYYNELYKAGGLDRFAAGQVCFDEDVDSLRAPHGVDKKLLKTIKREVWKYNPRGVNRYGLRITLDNDVVTSWDQKQ